MKTLIVTAADEKYAPLALDLIESVEPHRAALNIEMACVDLGLSAASQAAIGAKLRHLLAPRWPFRPHVKFDGDRRFLARAIRPFLPDLAQGYDCYLWLDADIWIQHGAGLAWLIEAAKGGDFAGVPTMHDCYKFSPSDLGWLHKRYRMAFGEPVAQQLMQHPYFNSGVMAARADSPLWHKFARRFQDALDRWEGEFLSDQAVLNGTLYLDGISVNRLPARLNWICHLALPLWNRNMQMLTEPAHPFEPLLIVHNTLDDKQMLFQLTNPQGEMRLTFSGIRKLKAEYVPPQ